MGRPPREPHGTAVPETPDLYGAYPRLTDEQIGLLAGHGRHQAVHAGQILIREGEPCEQVVVVLSGSVAIVEHHGTAEDHVQRVSGPGRFLGELGLLQGLVAEYPAREDGEVLSVPVDRLQALVSGDPALGDLILQPMITGTCFGAAAVTLLLAVLLSNGSQRALPEDVQRAARERQQRITDRNGRRIRRERAGGHGYRPGTETGRSFYSPGTVGTTGTASRTSAMADQVLDDEIEQVSQALAERGPTSREDLERTVGGQAWGPGRLRKALREAARESRAQSLPDDIHAPPGRSAAPGEASGTAANPREDGGDGR
jgi:CRP-like cAMP-binding protein